jgi:pimeloyl-ACP methyl ester carboxylesterase
LDAGATRHNRGVTATAQVNSVRLHYALEGEGPLVVLLHG